MNNFFKQVLLCNKIDKAGVFLGLSELPLSIKYNLLVTNVVNLKWALEEGIVKEKSMWATATFAN